MITRLIRFSVERSGVVLFFTALVCLWGWVSFESLPIDAIPDITSVQVQINTNVGGLAPEEIERSVTFPVESAVNGIPGVTQARSLTRFGLSQVTVTFEDGTDIYRARQLVSERLQGISDDLPAGAQPKLGPVSTGLGEIFHYTLEAETPAAGEARVAQLMEIRALQDWYIKPRLLTVKGVSEINTIGGFEKQFHIQPDPEKMARFGLRFRDLADAIDRANQNVGGGYVEQTAEQFTVQGVGLFRGVEDIRSTPVRTLESFRIVTVGDVARVGLGRGQRTGAALVDGREAVVGTVMMLTGENSRTVATRVSERVREIAKGLPAGYRLTPLYDRAELVNATLGTVEHNLLMGAGLVIVVLLLLVGNLRAALITAAVIPVSLLMTFIFMKRFGVSGNLMSLGALDFGIIVDGAVIVLDHCVRVVHERAKSLGRALSRAEVKEAVVHAATEIRSAAGFGELIIVVVFLPIFGLRGIEGKTFIPMAASFSAAVVSALALSFTLAPALASLFLRGDGVDAEPWLMRRASALYAKLLDRSLVRRRLVISSSIGAVLLGVALFAGLGGEFLPRLDEGSLVVQFARPANLSLAQSVALEEKSDVLLAEFPEVKTVFSRIGTAEVATDPMGVNLADTFVMLKPRSEWPRQSWWGARSKTELESAIVAKLESELPGQRASLTQPIEMRFNDLLEGTRAAVSVKVFGEDMEQLASLTQKIAELVREVPGAGDVEAEIRGKSKLLRVEPRPETLGRLGVPVSEVLETVAIGLGGHEVGHLFDGVRRFPIFVRLDDELRSDLTALRALPVGIATGTTAPLSEMAEVQFTQGYGLILREESKRRAAVLINPRGRDTESFVLEAQAKLEKAIQLPAGYFLEWGGNFKNLQESRARLAVLAPLALAFVLFMIYAAFRNFAQTLLVFACVPLALVGGVLGLIFSGLPFSISAGVGFIALSGIAVLNGVVLLSCFNSLRARGLNGEALVREGAMLRLRPVLMTALVDIFGFLPMVLSHGAGAEVQKPLASVVIGGILSSTALTLLVLPVLYRSFEARLAPSRDP